MLMVKGVFLKSEEEIEKIGKACKIARLILEQLCSRIHSGIKTGQIDEWARKLSKEYGVRPAFLGYHGYPASICVSINEEVVHGIPGARVLKEGDVVSLDFGVCFEGYYGDTAQSLVIGCPANPQVLRLLQVTEASLYAGIKKAVPGNRIGDISAAIQGTIESAGFAVVRDFVGHGLGKNLHEEPQIPGYGQAGTGLRIQPGMVLAIEPMANLGTHRVEILKDGWTAVTEDRSVSAHFEHTIAITDKGNRILTQCSKTEVGF